MNMTNLENIQSLPAEDVRLCSRDSGRAAEASRPHSGQEGGWNSEVDGRGSCWCTAVQRYKGPRLDGLKVGQQNLINVVFEWETMKMLEDRSDWFIEGGVHTVTARAAEFSTEVHGLTSGGDQKQRRYCNRRRVGCEQNLSGWKWYCAGDNHTITLTWRHTADKSEVLEKLPWIWCQWGERQFYTKFEKVVGKPRFYFLNVQTGKFTRSWCNIYYDLASFPKCRSRLTENIHSDLGGKIKSVPSIFPQSLKSLENVSILSF